MLSFFINPSQLNYHLHTCLWLLSQDRLLSQDMAIERSDWGRNVRVLTFFRRQDSVPARR